MAIGVGNIRLYGSAAMPNADSSLNGGVVDIANLIEGTLDEVFVDAYTKPASNGSRVVYRKIFLRNNHATDTLYSVKIYISRNDHNYVTIDLENSVGGADISPSRISPPTGYTFALHSSEATAHNLPGDGNLDAGEAIGIWLKLDIPDGENPDRNVILILTINARAVMELDYMEYSSDVLAQAAYPTNGHHTITFVNHAQLDTGAFKWGNASVLFDGADDKLTIPDSADWDIVGNAADDWTIDMWVKHGDHAGQEGYVTQAEAGGVPGANRWYFRHAAGLRFAANGAPGGNFVNTGTAGEISDTNWHH